LYAFGCSRVMTAKTSSPSYTPYFPQVEELLA
jgi:hypothetical protein